MKRMYGDVKHIAVLRGEMDRDNEIGADDVADARERYSRAGWKKNKYLYSDYNFKGNDVLTEPYFRPATSTTTTSTTTAASSPTTTSTTTSSTTVRPKTTVEPSTERSREPYEFENITLPAAYVAMVPANQTELPISMPATISTTLRIFPPAKISVIAESSAITPPQDYDDDEDGSKTATTPASSAIVQASTEAITTVADGVTETVVTLPSELLDSISKETTAKRGRPPASSESAQPLDGQFFQDVVQKEAQTGNGANGGTVVPPANARGV